MDAAALRAEFPVLQRFAFLNAGTCGPIPTAGVEAVADVLARGAFEGRTQPYFEAMLATRDRVREAYAALLGAHTDDVALTTCTSEGIVRVLAALDLERGDEIVTSDEEHPGLTGPLAAARAQRGVTVRAVPFDQVAEAAGPQTRLVATSHVSWLSGRVVPDLSGLGDVPVLLDGAQGIGAVTTDPRALGCSFYAGSGQKWLCGPVGSGVLWISPEWNERLPAPGPTYMNLADPNAGLDAVPHTSAARHDTASLGYETSAGALASLEVLGGAGWPAVHERAAALAQSLADELGQAGREVVARDRTTLVSWKDPEAAATKVRLAEAGVIVRDLPGAGMLRASVGAWNDEADLERLLSALA
jgi:L-cysteine/cystine lyase